MSLLNINNYIKNLDVEYQNLVQDVIKFALLLLTVNYLSSSVMSKNNPLCLKSEHLLEVFQVVVLYLVFYHLVLNKFVLQQD